LRLSCQPRDHNTKSGFRSVDKSEQEHINIAKGKIFVPTSCVDAVAPSMRILWLTEMPGEIFGGSPTSRMGIEIEFRT
jgi:hypothetical protein